MQSVGGDPISAEILDDKGEKIPLEIKDNEDGTYEVKFTAHRPSTYCLKVKRRKSKNDEKHELQPYHIE